MGDDRPSLPSAAHGESEGSVRVVVAMQDDGRKLAQRSVVRVPVREGCLEEDCVGVALALGNDVAKVAGGEATAATLPVNVACDGDDDGVRKHSRLDRKIERQESTSEYHN